MKYDPGADPGSSHYNNYKQYNLPGDDWMPDIIMIKHKIGLRDIFTSILYITYAQVNVTNNKQQTGQ